MCCASQALEQRGGGGVGGVGTRWGEMMYGSWLVWLGLVCQVGLVLFGLVGLDWIGLVGLVLIGLVGLVG